MRPFKMFFGLSLAIMLFFFVARFFVFAFIAATIMSIVYAVFRRLKDFINYDRYGKPYLRRYEARQNIMSNWNNEVEPLFYGSTVTSTRKRSDVHFVDIH